VPNEGRVYFALLGSDFDPELLDLGVRPTETRRRGNPRPKHSSWIFSTERVVADVVDIYSMSSAVIALLIPHEARIVAAMKAHKLEAVLEVVLTISPDQSVSTPAIGFDAPVVSFMSRVGGSIDVDTYRGVSQLNVCDPKRPLDHERQRVNSAQSAPRAGSDPTQKAQYHDNN